MKRTGRSGHTQFRVIVQDSRFNPSSGRVVAYLGNYDPHTKLAKIDSEKAAKYLENGAQPSDTVARLLKKEGVKLPDWVKMSQPQNRDTKNPDKRRSTRPAEPQAPVGDETPAVEAEATSKPAVADEAPIEAPAEGTPAEAPAEETPTEETPAAEETPADTEKA